MRAKAMRVSIKVTVDIVLFSKEKGGEEVLLIRRKNPPFENMWALPGGFIDPGESPETAARRELLEETGIELPRLEQFYTFGEPGRDPRGPTISVAHRGRVNGPPDKRNQPRAGSDAADVRWFSLSELPKLAFDHDAIIAKATEGFV